MFEENLICRLIQYRRIKPSKLVAPTNTTIYALHSDSEASIYLLCFDYNYRRRKQTQQM